MTEHEVFKLNEKIRSYEKEVEQLKVQEQDISRKINDLRYERDKAMHKYDEAVATFKQSAAHCPFCGGNKLSVFMWSNLEIGISWEISCIPCHVTMKSRATTIDDVLVQWNRREQKPQTALEMLNAAVAALNEEQVNKPDSPAHA